MSSAQASQLSQIMQGVNQGGGAPGVGAPPVRGINDGKVLAGANTTQVGVNPPPPLGSPGNPATQGMSDMAAQNNFGAQVANPFANMPQSAMTREEMMGRGIGGNFGQTTSPMDGISVPFSGPKQQDFLKLRERFGNGIFGRMGGLLK